MIRGNEIIMVLTKVGLINIGYNIIKEKRYYWNNIEINESIVTISIIISTFYMIYLKILKETSKPREIPVAQKEKTLRAGEEKETRGRRGELGKEMGWVILINYIAYMAVIYNNEMYTQFLIYETFNITVFIIILKHDTKALRKFLIIYFIISSIASIIFLLSITLLYNTKGVIKLDELVQYLTKMEQSNRITGEGENKGGKVEEIIRLSFYMGLFLKLGVAPFHYWVIALYKKVHQVITLYLTIIPKIFYLIVLYKFSGLYDEKLFIYFIIAIGLSLIIGSIKGISENLYKNIIGYSSIYNIGLIMLTLLVISFKETEWTIPLQYIIIYFLNTLNLILFFLFYYYNTRKPTDEPINIAIKNISTYWGRKNIDQENKEKAEETNTRETMEIYKEKRRERFETAFSIIKVPYLSFLLTCSILSLIGFPPYIGFYGKWTILSLILKNTDNTIITQMIYITIITLIISTVYYFKFITYTYIPYTNNYNKTYQSSNNTKNKTIILSYTSLIITFFPLFLPFIHPYFILFSHP